MIAFMQEFEDIAIAVLLPLMNVAVGATIIAALAVIIMHSTHSTSLRVGIKICFVLVFMTTIISATASMMQICAAEGYMPTAEDEVAQMPETGKALVRQEPKNDVSKHKLIRVQAVLSHI